MKIAIAQLNPIIGDLTGNAERILTAAQTAVERGAQLMITPELALCGYPPRDLLMMPDFIANAAEALVELAHRLPPNLAVLVGTVAHNPDASVDGEKPLFNSAALLHQGKIQQFFHKRLLPTYDVFDEDRYFEPSQTAGHFWLDLPVTSENSVRMHIGVTICEDLWNDEDFWGQRSYETNPISDLSTLQVDFTVNLSASPYTVGKQQIREAMLHHLAKKFNQPILYANQVGGNDDLIFDGSSFALNRQGELIARACAFEADLIFVEYDLSQHDLLPLETQPVTPLTETAEAEIWSALVLGVKDYARKCGFTKAVIGLSGGVDSALVAAIAAAALGNQNVLGVLMPSPYSSDHSINDAEQLAANLGIQTKTLPIGTLMHGYDETLADLFADTEFGLAEENIQSRIRGNLLMAISNKFGYLLLSTGNKSEMAVGYCTLYGDMNGGLAVIADVAKTRVYSICKWLNDQATFPTELGWAKEVIPNHILTKAPSAELKPGQVDQDSLPPYEILDDILVRFVQKHQTPEAIIAAGHAPETLNKVMRLVSRAEFKRRQAPPVLKVSDRAFGVGWRMPIAHRWVPVAK
ncbi:MAG TPA: NAD+ synthase [Leptolyngbyaceae cyanobacterium M33_DOE_097]|uniref:Glutamine-dependent NAD(+) synthetase n=1 Tax=Oscillatoriales cyanobacterium SpSt-418 TaxID=2282169 RepID=A0A7C3PJ24_9CYAN|nr:NAD+ synthase [Leptolyngbyaceae cyanobacterium M33_DOE_097]